MSIKDAAIWTTIRTKFRASLYWMTEVRVGMKNMNATAWKLIAEIVGALASTILILFVARKISATPVSDTLAVVAILFATVQFIDARLQERKMNAIAGSMSTQYIGLFPRHLKVINNVLSKTDAEICIIVDFIGYAQYSAPDVYPRYLAELIKARERKVDVSIICYDADSAEEVLREQLPEEKFEQEKNGPRFKTFFELNPGIPIPKSAEELRFRLRDRARDSAKLLREKGVQILYSKSATLFFWLGDDQEAVFAFKSIGRLEQGFSFRTQDGNLVRQFRDIFKRNWEFAEQAESQDDSGNGLRTNYKAP